MATFEPSEMIARYKERADAVKRRPLPPVAGEERQMFLKQAQSDFQDFAMIGDSEASLEDGILVLRIDLRPPDART
jgi:sulfur transfer protein SufE